MIEFLLIGTSILAQSQIQMSFDRVVFHTDTSAMKLVEFYYSIPYDELTYSKRGDTLLAEYQTTLKLRRLDGTDSVVETKDNQFVIRSFSYAWAYNLQVLDKLSYLLPAGEYEYEFAVRCSTKASAIKDRLLIEPDTGQLSLSDILLALNIIPDTTRVKFSKNQFHVIPNPSAHYEVKNKIIYGYMEIYSRPGEGEYEIAYEVIGGKGDTVKSMSRREKKISTNQTHVWGVSIAALKPGDYSLLITVRDSAARTSAVRRRLFAVAKEGQRVYKPVAVTGGKYYREIQYLVSEREYKRFLSYAPAGQDAYLANFWKKYDYEELERRMDYVDANYTVAGKPGRKTDRGRIYIKYGAPEEVAAHSFETGYKPNEYWKYYNPSYQFIFVDLRGTGDYVLVYSSTNKESTDPNWQKYVSQDEDEQYD